MLSTAQLQAIISANLTDESMYAVQVHMNDMIDRGNQGSGNPRYRFTYNGTPITTFDELTTALSTGNFKVTPTRNHNRLDMSVTVMYDDLHITVDPTYLADNHLAEFVGYGTYKFGLDIGYINGNAFYFKLTIIRFMYEKLA